MQRLELETDGQLYSVGQTHNLIISAPSTTFPPSRLNLLLQLARRILPVSFSQAILPQRFHPPPLLLLLILLNFLTAGQKERVLKVGREIVPR